MDTSSRPSFPAGLRVLLLDAPGDLQNTVAAVKQQHYEPIVARDLQHAKQLLQQQLQRQGQDSPCGAVDVALVDVSLLGDLLQQGSAGQELPAGARQVPVVLMGSGTSPADILQAVNQGAADYLDKPLSGLRLRNLWQHTIRAQLTGNSSGASSPKSTAGSPRTLQQQAAGWGMQTHRPIVACDEASPELHPLVDECLQADACLAGLQLPPLVPSQLSFDPDAIFQDLSRPAAQPGSEPCIDDLLGLAPHDELAAAAAATRDLLDACSSDQHCSGATVFARQEAPELSSSHAGGSPTRSAATAFLPGRSSLDASAASSSQLMTPLSVPGSPTTVMTTAGTPWNSGSGTPSAAAVAKGCPVAPMAMPGCGFYGYGNPYQQFWTPPPPEARGMVWGMPCPTIATVPGIVLSSSPSSKTGGASSKDGSPGSQEPGGMAMPQFLPPLPPVWPMAAAQGLMAPPAAAAAGGSAATQQAAGAVPGMMGMFPGMGFPGMAFPGFPGMPTMGMAYPGMGMPWPAQALPGMWPVAAPLEAGEAAPASAGAAAPKAACAAGRSSSAKGAAVAAALACRSGSLDSSNLDVCDLFAAGDGPSDGPAAFSAAAALPDLLLSC